MFQTNKRLGVRGDQILNSATPQSGSRGVGSIRPRQLEKSSVLTETSEFLSGAYGVPSGTSNSYSVSAVNTSQNTFVRMLEGIIPLDENRLRFFWDDIYENDGVAGTATDIMANMPFSEYSLIGLDETKINIFSEAISKLNIREFMPMISVEHKVQGCFIASVIWNNKAKEFTDILPYSLQSCLLDKMPTLNMDPLIRVMPDEILNNFLTNSDTQISKARSQLSPALINALRSGQAMLDPLTTLFVPRKTRAVSTAYNNYMFSSWYRRILPIYLLEKVLYRGTNSEASRRQRGSMHVQAGIEGEWEPTPEELNAISGLFQQADFDPLGAIIVTRHGIDTNTIREGGEFWKWTDLLEQTVPVKMRALGINDAFLSGDSNYSVIQGAIQLLLDKVKSDRDELTDRVFYKKLFPIIAVINGFYDKEKLGKELQGKIERGNTANAQFMELTQGRNALDMPQISWHKQLEPINSQEIMQTYEALTQKGVPISMRMWAASGGLSLDTLIDGVESDQNVRQFLIKQGYPAEIVPPEPEEAAVSSLQSVGRKGGILSRDLGEAAEPFYTDSEGKIHHVTSAERDSFEKNVENRFYTAVKEMEDPNVRGTIKGKLRAGMKV